jgi:CheY-like chemotaxis protein
LLAGAWEALLAEIEKKPSSATPSILQTLAQAADCLRILLNDGMRSMEPVPKARVLSVDDDEICNHVAVSALQRGNMDADSVQDANAALDLLKQNNYDLVLLDINMPGLTGFELCEKLRALPNHTKTPVIFVTAYNNFENRKQSVLSGGGDLIAKPVSPLELALKVTIHLLKAPAKAAVSASVAAPQAQTPLVWKEPVETISHDTEMRRNLAAQKGGSKPNVVVPTTETRTGEPEDLEASMARELKPAAVAVPEPVLQAATPIAPGPLAGLKMKTAEPKPIEQKTPPPVVVAPSVATPTTVAAPVVPPTAVIPAAPAKPAPAEPKPVLESATKSRALADEGKVVHTQPPQSSKPTAPISNGSSKPTQPMNKENNQQFETLVLDVAHIIFGDNAPDINVRLVRMALEQVWANRANLQSLDAIAREIARIIFGDASASDLNVRLVRMALERSNSIALFKAA